MKQTERPGEASIRVVLAELPPIVEQVVRGALLQGGIKHIEVVADGHALSQMVSGLPADVVIVPTRSSGVARQYHELLRHHPDLKVLTIAAAPSSADLFQLSLLGTNIGPPGLVAAIRAVAGNRAVERDRTGDNVPVEE